MIPLILRALQFIPTRLDVLALCLIAAVWFGAPIHAQMQRDADLREAVGASVEQIAAAIPESQLGVMPSTRGAPPAGSTPVDIPIPKHKPPVPVQLAQR